MQRGVQDLLQVMHLRSPVKRDKGRVSIKQGHETKKTKTYLDYFCTHFVMVLHKDQKPSSELGVSMIPTHHIPHDPIYRFPAPNHQPLNDVKTTKPENKLTYQKPQHPYPTSQQQPTPADTPRPDLHSAHPRSP